MSRTEHSATCRLEPSPEEQLRARLTHHLEHHGLTITATATRRVTGVTLVVTEVAGGPDGLKRNFYTISPEASPEAACRHALAEMCRVLDDGRQRGATAAA